MVILFVLLFGEVALFLERYRLRDTRRVYPHLADRHAFLLIHPDRVFIGVHGRLEAHGIDGFPDTLADRIVDDFVHIAGLQLPE